MARLFRGRNTAKVQPIAGKCGLPADSSAHVKEEEALPGSHTFGLNLCLAFSSARWYTLHSTYLVADHLLSRLATPTHLPSYKG